MMHGFENVQNAGTDSLNRTTESFGALTRGWQMLANETFASSKAAFADSTAYVEKMLGATSFDGAIEAQTSFLKDSAEKAIVQASRIGETSLEVVKDTMEPFEDVVPSAR